jgi:putative nucleotidyltransferase with HDIG domain
MSRRDEILAMIPKIPAIPIGASKAITLAQDPDADLTEMAKLIEYDPGLTANVLRLVNSPYFARSRTISSVRQALVTLGVRKVAQLVLASAVAPLASNAVKGYDLRGGELWEHFVGVAVGSVWLGERLGVPTPEHTFTSGLLHDIGKVVLGTFLEVDVGPIRALVQNEKLSFELAEQRILGIGHAETGAALLEAWNFPAEVVGVVRWHHEPEKTPGGSEAADLVHVADLICLMCGMGMGTDGLSYAPSSATMARLNIKENTAERLAYEVFSELESIRGMFANKTKGAYTWL